MSAVTRRLVSIYVLLGLVVLACSPSAASLARLWTDFDNLGYTHGFLVAACCLWLIFRAREELSAEPMKPSMIAAVLLAVCALAWLVFWRANIQVLHLVLLPVLIGLAIHATFGWRVARRLAVPIGMIYFAMPIWEGLAPALQALTVAVVGLMLKVAAVPVYTHGLLIYIPEGVFEVASGCSGLHFFVVGLALVAMLGEMYRDPWRLRIRLVAIMGGLALLANWLRVFFIVLAGHETKMQHSLITQGHYAFGWALFGGAVVIFLWFARRLPIRTRQSAAPAALEGKRFSAPGIAAVAIVAVIPAVILVARRGDAALGLDVPLTLPKGKDGWIGPLASETPVWQPVFVGAQGHSHAEYRNAAGETVEAFSVVYLRQRQGAELVGYDNSLFGSKLNPASSASLVQSPAGSFLETPAVDTDGARSLIWSAYTMGSQRFTSPLASQIGYGFGALIRHPPAGLMAFRAACSSSCDDARLRLGRFASQMSPGFQAILRIPGQTAIASERSNPGSASLGPS